MGQKVNPISNRLGIIRGWDSNWYGGNDYGDSLLEDSKIRKYLNARLAKASVSRIVIERTLKLVTITVCTARPGIIIGKGGQEVDKLKEELKKVTDKDIQINIFEVKRPELDAVIVANNIARQVEGKIAYRRAIKMAIANTMRMGAEGIKIQISGRLNGAEMARSEMYKEGRTPLHTLRADIGAHRPACPNAPYGRCGAYERGLVMVSVYSLWKADHHTGQPRRGQDLLCHASCGGLLDAGHSAFFLSGGKILSASVAQTCSLHFRYRRRRNVIRSPVFQLCNSI